MKHECPGLYHCLNHPRWHVIRSSRGRFYAYGPDLRWRAFRTFNEAINYAQRMARQ